MADIFLSYSNDDRARVEPLARALSALGWEVWWDPKILAGQTWDQVVESELDGARCVVVAWTANSVSSRWVKTEAEEGRRRNVLVPVLLEDVRIPLAFRYLQAADLVDWSGDPGHGQFTQLVQSISAIAPKAMAAAAAGMPRLAPPAAPAALLTTGMTRSNPRDGQSYVWIPPGTFVMGAAEDSVEALEDEKPAHRVALARGFWIGQTPVTVGAYARFQGRSPDGDPSLPQVNVSWNDARAYSEWAGLRLPTEAEWEYAARATTAGPRYGELDAIAWYAGNSGGRLHPVRVKQPNHWGLYDSLGNVWEWVADWYDGRYHTPDPVTDPKGPVEGTAKVLRGGSYLYDPGFIRVSYRDWYEPASRNLNIGFRCAGDLPPEIDKPRAT